MATPAKIVDQELPTVALVGRVNVGKSSLFNRIVEQRQALVSDIPGTTRTRNVATASWRGKNFRLIDTGGLTFSEDVPLEDDIIKQTEIALQEADLIVFVTDIQAGLLPQERELAKKLLKKSKDKPIILVANKADSITSHTAIYDKEWRTLGLGEPLPVSASNGSNVGDLLDLIYSGFNKLSRRPKKVKEEVVSIKVALMGRPNVGKSSLFNKLIGEERVIVSPMPHTTREPHDTLVEVEGQPLLFIDTAGIRRKAKVSGELEKIGIGKSIATINKADIVLLVLDATEPITDQDQQLAGLLREHTRSVIIIVNKWDLAEDNTDEFRNNVKKDIYASFPHLDYAPIVFVSAETGYRSHQIFPLIKQAWEGRQIVLSDEVLRDFLKRVTKKHLPTRDRGVRHPKVLGLTQLGFNPPMFEMTIKANTSIHISYAHYVANRLREEFGFFAAPIVMKLSKLKR
ncbi:MAG: ribosome biogenesis GTPase Der [Candidatus Magasanikbacteria bacterium RIFCSPHIGHO2_01_FULL_47_8]|uniref:GTPase Der n=1 Tax=Candidatus Magasanikbacteria bacterium RIFCSPHIGHO2_01_FULL_47_8 TaxID=1798673 RepID=A0A1F6MC23_9BACT|nr:MAG: ribosome biogenesis GTPase Der [Candidatus Magasanikbacteria bacterium RIFCSPHIGHO2_01_FULL_47_8]